MFAHAVDVEALEARLGRFFREQLAVESPLRGSVALLVDDKTLRGTIPVGQSYGVHVVAT